MRCNETALVTLFTNIVFLSFLTKHYRIIGKKQSVSEGGSQTFAPKRPIFTE